MSEDTTVHQDVAKEDKSLLGDYSGNPYAADLENEKKPFA